MFAANARCRRTELLTFGAAGAAMAAFVAVGIQRPVWLDEAISFSIARGGFRHIAERLRDDNNFPAYYFLLHAWTALFGESEVAARLLSGFFYAAGTLAMYGGARWLGLGKRNALYCGFFYLASMQAIRQAQNVRMYSLLGLLAAISTAAFCREFVGGGASIGRWRLKPAPVYVAANAAGLLTHLWFPFVLAGQLAATVWMRPKRLKGFMGMALISGLPFAVLWSASFWQQLHNGATASDWMPIITPGLALRAGLDFYGSAPVALGFYAACAILIVQGRSLNPPGKESIDATLETYVRAWAVCAAVSLGVPLAISAVKPIFWPGRYTIIALPAVAFLLGTLLSRFAPRRLLWLLCCGLLTFDVAGHVGGRAVNPETAGLPAGHSDQATADFLLQNARPGDAVIFTSLSRPAVDYYFLRGGANTRFAEISFPRENGVHLGWRDRTARGARRDALRAEAAAVAETLRPALAGGSKKLWVLYGFDVEVSGILKERLDSSFRLSREHAVRGPFHSHVLEYGMERE